MNWQDIRDNPLFKDLPFKFETDRWGHIVMSPATNKRSWLQGEILGLLRRHLPNGRVLPECSIQTSEGVKVADAVWASPEFFTRGAREFRVCREDGGMLFYNNHARIERSALAPDFPPRVELPA